MRISYTNDSVAGGLSFGQSQYIKWGTTDNALTTNDGLIGYQAGLCYWYRYNGSGYTQQMVLDTSGNLTATGNVTAYSDARVKENVTDYTLTPAQISALRSVEYDRTDLGRHEVGVIAQEVEQIVPECVVTGELGKSVDYGRLALLVALSLSKNAAAK
jgi:hypothetical protein